MSINSNKQKNSFSDTSTLSSRSTQGSARQVIIEVQKDNKNMTPFQQGVSVQGGVAVQGNVSHEDYLIQNAVNTARGTIMLSNDYNHAMLALQQANQTIQSQNEILATHDNIIKEKNSIIIDIGIENAELTSNLYTAVDVNKELNTHLNYVRSECSKAHNVVKKQDNYIINIQQKNKNLKTELTQSNQELRTEQEKHKITQDKLEASQTQNTQQAEEITNLTAQNVAMNLRLIELEKLLAQKTNEVTTPQTTDQSTQTNSLTQTTDQSTQTDVTQTQAQLNTIQETTITDLTKKLKDEQKAHIKTQSQLNKEKSENNTIKNYLEAEKTAHKNTAKYLRLEVKELKYDLSTVYDIITVKTTDIQNIQNQNTQLSILYKKALKTIEELSSTPKKKG